MCFSYPPGLLDSQNLSATRPALAGLRRMPVPCFSYPHMCFSYPDNVPLGNRDAAQASPRDPQIGYPCFSYSKLCFSYPPDAPLGVRNTDAAQPPLPGLRRMPSGTCFRY
jgi:hypothetical protein